MLAFVVWKFKIPRGLEVQAVWGLRGTRSYSVAPWSNT